MDIVAEVIVHFVSVSRKPNKSSWHIGGITDSHSCAWPAHWRGGGCAIYTNRRKLFDEIRPSHIYAARIKYRSVSD